jgi:hypothetical protein
VLEGYVYLGNVASLGEEVMAAFAAVVNAAALKVARGVVLTRPTAGLEERAKSTQLLQELVKWLPPDLFRTCLTRVRAFFCPHSLRCFRVFSCEPCICARFNRENLEW